MLTIVPLMVLMPCLPSALHSWGKPQPPVIPHRTETILLQDPSSSYMPLSPAPPVKILQLNGSVWSSTHSLNAMQPVIYNIGKPNWGFSQALWHSNSSIDGLLNTLPANVAVTFISDAVTSSAAKDQTSELKALFKARALVLNATKKLVNLVFSQESLTDLSVMQPWLTELLCQWPTFLDQMHVSVSATILYSTRNHNNTEIVDHTEKLPNTSSLMSSFDVPMVNSFYDWLGWNFWPSTYLGNGSFPLTLLEASCNGSLPSESLNGSIVIIVDTGECDSFTMVKRASETNASGVIVVAAEPTPHSMNCVGQECNDQSIGLPAVSIGSGYGALILKALTQKKNKVTVSFSTEEQCGTNFAQTFSGDLVQAWGGSGLGNPLDPTYGNPGDIAAKQYPSLEFFGYAAQNMNYLASVDVKNSMPAIVHPVFNRTHMRPAHGNCYNAEPWGCGPSQVIRVPPPKGNKESSSYSNVVLDYYLQCNTTADISCPQWDHVIQLKACCSQQPLQIGLVGKVNSTTSTDTRIKSMAKCNAQDGFELGRWITSFGRGNGHWRTDVTSWLPLLRPGAAVASGASSYCNLTIYTVPWAGNQGQIPWLATLNMRFENSSKNKLDEPPTFSKPSPSSSSLSSSSSSHSWNSSSDYAPFLVPISVLTPWKNVSTNKNDGIYTLFKWIAFNQSYETYFDNFSFSAPIEGFVKAELVTVLSGHGNDNHGCGEFCTTTHHFTLTNYGALVGSGLSFTNIKVNDGPNNAATGCAEISELELGTTPNEYGTWLYGRDGWCDGRGVIPWVRDITSQLNLLMSSQLRTDMISSEGNHDAQTSGEQFTLSYRGLWNGTIPDPSSLQQGSPVMMMQTYIVFWDE